MNIKLYLDSHPLVIIIGLGVAVATTTAGVVQYFSDKSNEMERTRINTEHTIEVSTLKSRLASIERKIGEGTAFFDVSRLIVLEDGIKNLGDDFKTIDDGQFFIAEPKMNDWTYALTSELELLKDSITLDDMDPIIELMAPMLGKENLHLWRNNLSIRFRTADEDMEKTTFTLFPYVGVQMLKASELIEMGAAFHEALDTDFSLLSKRLDSVLEELDLATASETVDPLAEVEESVVATAPAIDSKAKYVDSTIGQSKLEVEAQLAELFRGDLATIVLAGLSIQMAQMPVMFPGAKSSLQTVQKKGNVLYIQSAIRFTDVELVGGMSGSSVSLDQEFFVVTNADAIYIVKIQVPSIDGRSEAFPWVREWLSGFRVPIRAM